MKITKNKKIKWILRIIFFLTNFFIIYLYPWINIFFRLIIYLCNLFIIAYYTNIIIIELNINVKLINNFRNKIIKIFAKFSLIYIFIYILEIFTISINLAKYETDFLKNCPYILNDLNYKLHLRRRCELYNINKNSRYSYKYICSYDSSQEFKYKDLDKNRKKIINKEIEPDYVICVQAKKLLTENMVIDLFNKEYKNTQKYFCSRTNKPKAFIYAKSEDCNNLIKYIFNIFLFIVIIFQGPYLLMNYYSIKNIKGNMKLVEENIIETQKTTEITEMTDKSKNEKQNSSNEYTNKSENNMNDESNKTINKISLNNSNVLFNDKINDNN